MSSEDDALFDSALDADLLDVQEPPAKRKSDGGSLFDPPEPEPEIKSEPQETSSLSKFQQSRSEKNRLKALSLRKAKLISRPTTADSAGQEKPPSLTEVSKEKKVVDSGAGFFIEEDPQETSSQGNFTELPAPIIEPDRPECLECGEDLAESYLLRTFDLSVCDKCKDTAKDGKHELITKTEAKNVFLLKDFDLDKREPILRFMVRKNPHNSRWGEMKLYLRSQVEDRALEVWGTEAALEKEHEIRGEKKEKVKVKRFNKQIKALRMQVRGSLYKKDLSVHEHDFGEEVYDEEEDEYCRSCRTCPFVQKYEKM